MDFLDQLISDQQFNEDVDQSLLAQIENLIWYSSLDDKEKARKMRAMLKLESTEDAMKMVLFLKEFQPIVGIHRVPITQYEIVETVRLKADIDDFYDRKK